MRFLFVSEYYPPMHMGGAEISLKLLVEGLAKLGHDVTVLTPNYSAHRTDVDVHRNLRIIRFKSWRYFLFRRKTRELSSSVYTRKRPLFYLQLGGYIRLSAAELRKNAEKLLERENFDVVHANNLESILALSGVKTDALKIAHLRDFGILCWNRGLNNREELCSGCSIQNIKACMRTNFAIASILAHEIKKRKNVLENFDKLVAISNFVKKQFVGQLGIDESKIAVLYNPIDPEIISELSKVEARTYLGLPIDTRIVLFVGTLTELKGAHIVLELAKRLPQYYFVVVGDGPLREKFRLANLPNLKYVGYKPLNEVKHYYKAADVLIVPSLWHEPFGRVVVEGVANGCFVIGSNRGAIPEVIQWTRGGKCVEPELENFIGAITSHFKNPVSLEHSKSIVLNYSKEYPYKVTKLIVEARGV